MDVLHEGLGFGVPPSWRWDLACRLAADRRRILQRHRSDPHLLAAIDHLRDRPDAAIAAALALLEAGGARRWATEAWLLAGLDDAGIAARTGLPPAAVAVYEPLFFDVRRHLPYTDWLVLRCVGPAAWRGFRRYEVRQLWALAAMAAGPLLVDLLVAPVVRAATVRPTLDVYDHVDLDPRLRRWIAARRESLDVARIESLSATIRGMPEPAGNDAVARPGDVADHLQCILDSVPHARPVEPPRAARPKRDAVRRPASVAVRFATG